MYFYLSNYNYDQVSFGVLPVTPTVFARRSKTLMVGVSKRRKILEIARFERSRLRQEELLAVKG